MFISNAGKVGIGTSSPASNLHVYDGNSTDAFKVENYNRGVVFNSVGGGGMYSEYQLQGTAKFRMGQANHLVSGESAANFAFSTVSGDLIFSTSVTERMRLTNSGKLGIGKSNGTGMLNIQSNADYTRLIELYGSGSSSGVASLRLGISGNNSQVAMIGGVSSGYAGLSYHYYYLIPQIQQSDNNGDLRLGGASNRFHTVYSVNGTSTSDERVKEEIENLDVGLAFIKSLQPKKFKYKDKDSKGNYKDGNLEQKNGVKKWGLIAQDVKKALDDNSITEDIGLWSFEKGECNGEVIENQQQLQYQELISPLIKAIQELEARIATLEG